MEDIVNALVAIGESLKSIDGALKRVCNYITEKEERQAQQIEEAADKISSLIAAYASEEAEKEIYDDSWMSRIISADVGDETV